MKTSDTITLFQQFAEMLALVLTHSATPASLRDAFLSALVAYSAPPRELGSTSSAALLRVTFLRAVAVDLAHTPPIETKDEAPVIYPPAIEARRENYARIAESLCALLDTQRNHSPVRLGCGDSDSRPGGSGAAFTAALDLHFDALHKQADWFDPATVRHFYVEMRLWADYLAAQQVERAER